MKPINVTGQRKLKVPGEDRESVRYYKKNIVSVRLRWSSPIPGSYCYWLTGTQIRKGLSTLSEHWPLSHESYYT